jgi:hypothetical protein
LATLGSESSWEAARRYFKQVPESATWTGMFLFM